MTDNSTQTGADTIRDKDRSGVKTQVVGLDLNVSGATETLMAGQMPTTLTSPNGLAAGLFATMSAYGYQRVTTEPSLVFMDPFDGGVLDTTVRWNTPTGTVTEATGGVTIGNTTVSTQHYLTTQGTFQQPGLNFNVLGFVATLEASPLTTNVARFMGFGIHTGTPTAAIPVTDGVGFEWDGAGNLRCSVWINGVRSASSVTVNASAVAGPTRYAVLVRSDLAVFYIGSTETPVASVSFATPATQTLPIRFQQVNQSTVTGTPSTNISAVAVHDTGHNNLQLSDGTYPWRKARVTSLGDVSVAARGAAVTGTSGAIAAAGTGTIGPPDVSAAGNVTFVAKNTVAASAWAGAPVLVFEQSDDNVSWGALPVVRNDTQQAGTTFILGANTASAEIMFDAGAEAINYVRCRVTTGPTTNGMTIVIGAGGMPFSPIVTTALSPTTSLPMGTATGTTAASTGQVGRTVRATANVAQTTAATLIAAPAAGTRLYITNIVCANEGATLTVVRLFAGTLPAAAGAVAVINDCFDFPIAASGGGATVNFPPNAPWGLPLATALSFAVTVATTWDISVTYFVGP